MGFSDDPRKVSDNPAKIKNSPYYTDEEKDLVSDYRSLDKPGKRAVQVTVADQKQRVSDEQKKPGPKPQRDMPPEKKPASFLFTTILPLLAWPPPLSGKILNT